MIYALQKISHNVIKFTPSMARDASYAMRDGLRETSSEAFSYPRPFLSKKIIAKKVGKDWAVMMPNYGKIVDVGRRKGRMPPSSPEIKRWAREANINLFWFRRSIGKYGTQPRPFINEGLARGQEKIPEILSGYGKKIIGGK